MAQYFPPHVAKGYTLDLAFSTLPERDDQLIKSSDYLVPLDAHHNRVFFKLSFKQESCINTVKSKLDFRKADYEAINSELINLNWNELFNSNSIVVDSNKFHSILDEIIKNHVPLKRESSSTYPSWYSHSLISLIIS